MDIAKSNPHQLGPSVGSCGSRNFQLGIHLAKIATIFTKIIAIFPCFAKIFGIHKNTKEDPWCCHCLWGYWYNIVRTAGPSPTINTTTFFIAKTKFDEVAEKGCDGRIEGLE
jgi:hypothetical protein